MTELSNAARTKEPLKLPRWQRFGPKTTTNGSRLPQTTFGTQNEGLLNSQRPVSSAKKDASAGASGTASQRSPAAQEDRVDFSPASGPEQAQPGVGRTISWPAGPESGLSVVMLAELDPELDIEIDLNDSLAGNTEISNASLHPTATVPGLRSRPVGQPSRLGQKRVWRLPFVVPKKASELAAIEQPSADSLQLSVRSETRNGGTERAQDGQLRARAVEGHRGGVETTSDNESALPFSAAGKEACGSVSRLNRIEVGRLRCPVVATEECTESPGLRQSTPAQLLAGKERGSTARKRSKVSERKPKQPLKRAFADADSHDPAVEERLQGGDDTAPTGRQRNEEGVRTSPDDSHVAYDPPERQPSGLENGRHSRSPKRARSSSDADCEDEAVAKPSRDARRPTNPFVSAQSKAKNAEFKQEVLRRQQQQHLPQPSSSAVASVLRALPKKPAPGTEAAPIDLTEEEQDVSLPQRDFPAACFGSDEELEWAGRPPSQTVAPDVSRGLHDARRCDPGGSASLGSPWWHRLPDFVPLAALSDGINPRTGAIVHIDYKQQFEEDGKEVSAAAAGSSRRAGLPKKRASGSQRAAPGASKKTFWARKRGRRR